MWLPEVTSADIMMCVAPETTLGPFLCIYIYLSEWNHTVHTFLQIALSLWWSVLCPAASTCLYNESVSQVRFVPELLEDQDPIGMDPPPRWKRQVPKDVPFRWAWLVSTANTVKQYGSFVAREDQGFFPKLVSCFWRNTCSLKALAVISTCPLRSVVLQKKILEVFFFLRFFNVDHF